MEKHALSNDQRFWVRLAVVAALVAFTLYLWKIQFPSSSPTTHLSSQDEPNTKPPSFSSHSTIDSDTANSSDEKGDSEIAKEKVQTLIGEPYQFLATEYEALDDWLNEKFEVRYRAMTPALIFDQVPLNDIHYETSNLPDSSKGFNFESDNLSRRELLEVISGHWELEMDFIYGEDGLPSAIQVTGRSTP